MGVAAVGASATAGLTATDAQRLKMIISGMGPSAHPAVPLPSSILAEAAATEAGAGGDTGDAEGTKEDAAEEDAVPPRGEAMEAEELETPAAGEAMEE